MLLLPGMPRICCTTYIYDPEQIEGGIFRLNLMILKRH